jgi:hypothetical protein
MRSHARARRTCRAVAGMTEWARCTHVVLDIFRHCTLCGVKAVASITRGARRADVEKDIPVVRTTPAGISRGIKGVRTRSRRAVADKTTRTVPAAVVLDIFRHRTLCCYRAVARMTNRTRRAHVARDVLCGPTLCPCMTIAGITTRTGKAFVVPDILC